MCVLFRLGWFELGLATPMINGAAGDLCPSDRQGEVFGLSRMGFLIAPVVGGVLFGYSAASPYLLAGSLLVVASFFMHWSITRASDPSVRS